MRRFIIDAQLPPGLTELLVEAGCQADHVNRLGLGAASDETIWRHAAAVNAAILTKDADFRRLPVSMLPNVPIIWLRIGNGTNTVLKHVLGRALPQILSALDDGETFIEVR